MTIRKGAMLMLTLVACGGAGGTPPDLTGTWNATKYEFASTSTTARADLVAQGVSATVTFRADKTYEVVVKSPGQPDEIMAGTFSVSSDVLTLRQTGRSGDQQFQYTLAGNTLTLSGADADFDFDANGTTEAAKLNVVAVRG